MSEVFENDIEKMNEDLSALEDPIYENQNEPNPADFVYPSPLFKLKLEYSSEGVYATAKGSVNPKAGDFVIIPTRYGKDLAFVMGNVKTPIGIRPDDVVYIDRVANAADLAKREELEKKEASAFKIFQEKVAIHKLEMKLIATHYLLEEQKVLFFFSAEQRVDFRELVKDLVSVFKMRIELRQIGVRDESRVTGGLGVCGRPYCCHAVSDRLKPVSIRMAKDQNLSLNSMKISGQCGRLLCCLSYEHECYTDARKNMPPEGMKLTYDGTAFRITEINPLNSTIKILGEDGRLLELPASRFILVNNHWKVTN